MRSATGGTATFALQAGTAGRTDGYDRRSALLSHFDFRQRTGFADEETVMRLSQAN
jgi:hypothetical protein